MRRTRNDFIGAWLVATLLGITATGCPGMLRRDTGPRTNDLDRYPGVERIEGEREIQRLLELTDRADVAVLVVDSELDKPRVSDIHLERLREWIHSGGVLWVAGDGLESEFAHNLVDYRVDDFTFKKAASGKRGGELIVRGGSPRLEIHDHPLTEGVERLYIYPRYSFAGSRDLIRLVEMTDSRGAHGVVLAARKLGQDYVVLDGTARSERRFFGRIPGFDETRPNEERTASGWNSYDWPLLYENAVELAESGLGPREIYGRPR